MLDRTTTLSRKTGVFRSRELSLVLNANYTTSIVDEFLESQSNFEKVRQVY